VYSVERNQRTGGFLLPVRAFCRRHAIAAAVALAFVPASQVAPSPAYAQGAALAPVPADTSVEDFYRARNGAPLWLAGGNQASADKLLILLQSVQVDGLSPSKYDTKKLSKVLRKAWGGDPRAVARADRMLSEAFVTYVNDLKRVPTPGMTFVDPVLSPRPQSAMSILLQAASAPSLPEYVSAMGWMNPIYAALRQAIASGAYAEPERQHVLAVNLARARALPASGRYILVNPAQQKLYMYDNGRVADSMNVVVGKQKWATPMFASYLRYASLNPYWNVPPDLVGEDIAVFVLKYGVGYLKSRGYQVLSDWTDNATPVDPTTVDWQSVMDGKTEIRVRQLPGPRNVLGTVKYSMPNPFGVYLHDTSSPELLNKDIRLFSGGCIRLQDAKRLGTWLFGKPLLAPSKDPDIQVPLATPVPVFVTYLTAVPDGGSIAFLDDVYGRDGVSPAGTQKQLASAD
jgi:L,D-transpeptidase YcbB